VQRTKNEEKKKKKKKKKKERKKKKRKEKKEKGIERRQFTGSNACPEEGGPRDLGAEESGGRVVRGAQGRHMNQSVDPGLPAGLCHPPGTLNMGLLVAEVSVDQKNRRLERTFLSFFRKKKKEGGKFKPCLEIASNQVEHHL